MRISVFRVVLNLTQDMWRLGRYIASQDLYFGSSNLLFYVFVIRFIKYIEDPGIDYVCSRAELGFNSNRKWENYVFSSVFHKTSFNSVIKTNMKWPVSLRKCQNFTRKKWSLIRQAWQTWVIPSSQHDLKLEILKKNFLSNV